LPIDVHLVPSSIIPGWVTGLNGICEGAKVSLVVPPELGEVTDPPGGTIRYEIEILEVSDEPLEPPDMFAHVDKDADGYISLDEFQTHFSAMNNGNPVPFALFQREDVNLDGSISWHEFSGPKGLLPPPNMKPEAPKGPTLTEHLIMEGEHQGFQFVDAEGEEPQLTLTNATATSGKDEL
jgi:hypothetical protein